MSFKRVLSGAAILSLLSLQAYAAPSIDDIYKVRLTGEGSCEKYHGPNGNGQLERMFNDMQKVLHEANTVIAKDYQSGWNDKARGLAAAFWGLKSGDDGKTPADGTLDGDILKKIKGSTQQWMIKGEMFANQPLQSGIMMQILAFKQLVRIKPRSSATRLSWTTKKPATSCRGMMARFPSMMMGPPKRSVIVMAAEVYWFPELKTYLDFKKNGDPPPGTYPGSNKRTYCAADDRWGWTIEPATDAQYIILCPRLFAKKVPDELDLSAATDGTSLNDRESKSLTWLHEIFHLEFMPADDGNGNWVTQSPDAKTRKPRMTQKGVPYVSWPGKKAGFTTESTDTIGAIQCMHLALWDRADKIKESIDLYESAKNPETYAWFAVAYYLSTQGEGKSDWSTGAARPDGSKPASVQINPKAKREVPTTFITMNSVQPTAMTHP